MFKIILLKVFVYIANIFGFGGAAANAALGAVPECLEMLAKKCKIIFICGSCGKSTTAAQTCTALKVSGAHIISGKGGKNDILVSLIKSCPVSDDAKEYFALYEVDATEMADITKVISPNVVAVTNIFDDKNPDYDIYKVIEDGCKNLKDTVFVLNGDEPMLFSFMQGSRRYFYGFRTNPDFPGGNMTDEEGKICKDCDQPYKYIYNTYVHLGNYSCPNCGKTRPQLALGVDSVLSLTENGSQVSFDGLNLFVPLAGGDNIYNALCAATIAGAVGVGPDDIKSGIESVDSISGVQETVKIDTKELRLISVGSALDYTESINSILPDHEILYIACLLSKSDAAWIDGVPFEKLLNLNYHGVLIGGSAYRKMRERLEESGLDTAKFMVCEDFDSFLYSIRTNVIGKTYVFASKNAMKALRKNLYKKRYIKKL